MTASPSGVRHAPLVWAGRLVAFAGDRAEEVQQVLAQAARDVAPQTKGRATRTTNLDQNHRVTPRLYLFALRKLVASRFPPPHLALALERGSQMQAPPGRAVIEGLELGMLPECIIYREELR